MKFETVWLSSVAHLEAFAAIISGANFLEKMFGHYRMPDGFPYVRPGWGRVPIVMFATGDMEVEGDQLRYSARSERRPPLSERHNMRLDITFALDRREITAVEAFKRPSPMIAYYSMPFTRIRTARDGDLADFLLCVGGSGPSMSKINEKNAELADALRTWLT